MSDFLHSFTQGTRSFELAYLLVQIPMWVALVRRGASYDKYLKSPLIAAPLMILVAAVLSWMPESNSLFVSISRYSLGAALYALLGYAGGAIFAKERASPEGKYRR